MSSRICGIFATKDLSLAREENLLAMLNAFQHQKTGQRDTFVDKQAGIAIGYLGESNRKEKQGFSNNSWHTAQDFVIAIDGYVSSNHPNKEYLVDKNMSIADVAAALDDSPNHFPESFDGHFALAAWNKQRRELWLARDPVGVRPLYFYSTNTGSVLFASEPKGILAHPAVSRELSDEGFVAYLTFGYVPAPYSMFKNMFKIFPGQAIQFINPMQAKKKQYWQPPAFLPGDASLEEYANKTKEYILDNIYQNVKGQNRIGLYYSAGIDSSILLAAIQELGVPETFTFTVGFAKPAGGKILQSDLDWSLRYSRQYQTRHQTVKISETQNLLRDLLHIWRQFDEPILTPNVYTKALLANTAREAGVDICLSGSNAEVGFKTFTPKQLKKMRHPKGKKLDSMEAILEERTRFIRVEHQNALLPRPPGNCKDIALGILERYRTQPTYDRFLELYKDNLTLMHAPDKAIVVQDRTASMHQLDIRFPFISAKLIEFSRTIPLHMHWQKKNKCIKSVLIKAFEELLPSELISRKKVGFPSYYWNNSELDPLIERLLSRKALEKSGILNPDTVEALLQEDRQDRGKSAGRLTWGLLSLQAWYEIHINRNDEILEF